MGFWFTTLSQEDKNDRKAVISEKKAEKDEKYKK